MSPFSVTVQHVADRELGPLLTRLAEAGFNNPTIDHLGQDGAPAAAPGRAGPQDLPLDWRLVREREGESYGWPNGRDRYVPYRVFLGTTRAEGAVQIGLGETIRENKWGRDRKYVVAFLSAGSPQQPLSSLSKPTTTSRRASSSQSSAAVTAGAACMASVTPYQPSTPEAFEPRSTTSEWSTRAPGTRSSWSPAKTTTRRSSTTP